MPDTMPVYVKLDEYDAVLQMMQSIRDKVDEAKKTLSRVNELKQQEDAELEHWHASLEEVEQKINALDQSLHEPEAM